MDKLQHIYDRHAEEFGLSGNKNTRQLRRLRELLSAHVQNTDTQKIPGWYRGQQAVLFYNNRTRIVVVEDTQGELIAAYKASEAQAMYIQTTRRLN